MKAWRKGSAGSVGCGPNSDVGLSLVFAEFAWGTDVYRARQLVQERLQAVSGSLPEGIKPGLTPVSSLMGEILLVGLRSRDSTIAPRELARWRGSAKDGKFVIHLLDANDKPMPLGERTLTITAGERQTREADSCKSAESFTAVIPMGDEYPIVFQVREKQGAKPLTARMNFDAKPCPECKKPEWMCACGSKEKKP